MMTARRVVRRVRTVLRLPDLEKIMSNYKPNGSVPLPGMMCGVVAAALAIGLDVMGYFTGVDLWLREVVERKPFYLTDPIHLSPFVSYFAAIAAGWLVAIAVLDSAGWWRRLLVGAMSLMVVVCFCPVLVLWGVYWSPVTLIVAVAWGWFCSMVYSGQHLMPCDVLLDDNEESSSSDDSKLVAVKKTSSVKVETIQFPVPFKSVDDGGERGQWQPKVGNGED